MPLALRSSINRKKRGLSRIFRGFSGFSSVFPSPIFPLQKTWSVADFPLQKTWSVPDFPFRRFSLQKTWSVPDFPRFSGPRFSAPIFPGPRFSPIFRRFSDFPTDFPNLAQKAQLAALLSGHGIGAQAHPMAPL
ncbi:MAG: hypothetical protein KF778_02920 [Rhodocyclaceae bacterium]|nr:hypothetical protein [Rhodocyclaceae bacterium]